MGILLHGLVGFRRVYASTLVVWRAEREHYCVYVRVVYKVIRLSIFDVFVAHSRRHDTGPFIFVNDSNAAFNRSHLFWTKVLRKSIYLYIEQSTSMTMYFAGIKIRKTSRSEGNPLQTKKNKTKPKRIKEQSLIRTTIFEAYIQQCSNVYA